MDKVKVVTADGQIVYVPPGAKVFVDGMEVNDPTPVEMPVDCEQPESLESMIARMVHAVSREVGLKDETIEEAEDFDMDEEDDFMDNLTAGELHAMMTARELREEVPKEKVRGERAKGDTRDSGSGKEDDDSGEEPESRHSDRKFRKRDTERGDRRAERRGEGVARRGAERRYDVEEDSADVGEGDE